ncbi:MAG TPA: DUF2231 domain-containing protein [Jiangellaceae bacterium]|nr:DUF2231 domain-containing protein [Jiangellaceae bacterium]
MPDTVFGIPLHPLVIHAVVVLVPLSVLGTVAIALVPRWRGTYGWLVVAASAVSFAAVPLATRSGENLKESLSLGGPVLEKVNEHQDMGERVIWAVGAMFVFDLLLMLAHRAGRPAGQRTALAALATLAALVSLVLVVLTGHLGSTAVWNPAG